MLRFLCYRDILLTYVDDTTVTLFMGSDKIVYEKNDDEYFISETHDTYLMKCGKGSEQIIILNATKNS